MSAGAEEMHEGLHSWGTRGGFVLYPLPPEALLFPGKPQECLHPSAVWKCKANCCPQAGSQNTAF